MLYRMEINTLVYVGIALILVSIGLFAMNHFNDVTARLVAWRDRLAFNANVKKDLKEVDAKIKEAMVKKAAAPEVKKTEAPEVKKVAAPEVKKTEAPEVKKPSQKNKEVYLVANNIFQREDSQKVCKAFFNADVATMKQLEEGYNNGANWCNYGWTAEGKAFYPLQKSENNPRCFGERGMNGGTMENTSNIMLGVMCYGEKPDENHMTVDKLFTDSSMAQNDLQILDAYRKRLNLEGVKIAPFNSEKWNAVKTS